MNQEEYVKVPVKWLERLMELAEGEEEPLKTALLRGYISSASTIIKYNKL